MIFSISRKDINKKYQQGIFFPLLIFDFFSFSPCLNIIKEGGELKKNQTLILDSMLAVLFLLLFCHYTILKERNNHNAIKSVFVVFRKQVCLTLFCKA